MSLPVRSSSALPEKYQQAKAALEQCVKVDECASWADKAKAVASYAAQSKDESLYKAAIRIRARAIRRCGELLAAIEPQQGGVRGATGRRSPIARSDVASAAGLSVRQRKTALRVAKVPRADFEAGAS
jgi:hypothetical protein